VNPSQDMLDFVGTALRVFGPDMTLLLKVGDSVGRFSFPPDRAWRAPRTVTVPRTTLLKKRRRA